MQDNRPGTPYVVRAHEYFGTKYEKSENALLKHNKMQVYGLLSVSPLTLFRLFQRLQSKFYAATRSMHAKRTHKITAAIFLFVRGWCLRIVRCVIPVISSIFLGRNPRKQLFKNHCTHIICINRRHFLSRARILFYSKNSNCICLRRAALACETIQFT